jgi:hypothetical protein
MTTLIILPHMYEVSGALFDRVIDDLFEAIRYESEHDFVTRVALEKFDKNGLPVYEKIPDDEMTYVEARCEGSMT